VDQIDVVSSMRMKSDYQRPPYVVEVQMPITCVVEASSALLYDMHIEVFGDSIRGL